MAPLFGVPMDCFVPERPTHIAAILPSVVTSQTKLAFRCRREAPSPTCRIIVANCIPHFKVGRALAAVISGATDRLGTLPNHLSKVPEALEGLFGHNRVRNAIVRAEVENLSIYQLSESTAETLAPGRLPARFCPY